MPASRSVLLPASVAHRRPGLRRVLLVAVLMLSALVPLRPAVASTSTSPVLTTSQSRFQVLDTWQGAGAPNYCGGPSQATCAAMGLTVPPEVQVRWGQATGPQPQRLRSGMGFHGSSALPVTVGDTFPIAQFTHFNFPVVNAAATQVRLHTRVGVVADGTTLFDQPVALDFALDETPNTAPCVYPSTTVCADKVTIQMPAGGLEFVHDTTGVSYTLTIEGFRAGPDDTSLAVSEFVSQENTATTLYLFASFRQTDTAPPTIAASRSPEPNSHGWHNTPVTVSYTCADETALASCSDPQTLSGEGADQQTTGTAIDLVGNTASVTEADIDIDLTGPTLTGAPTVAPTGANGWYVDDVTVSWTATDVLSGIDPATVPAPTILTTESDSATATASVSDLAGNTTAGTVSGIRIDKHAPTTLATVPSGWVSEPSLDVQLVSSDNLSGVATQHWQVDDGPAQTATGASATAIVAGDGARTLTYWATDVAGNASEPTTVTVDLDDTDPTIGHTIDPTPNAAGWTRTDTTVTFTCDDATTTVSCTPPTTIVDEGANQTVVGTATDEAGNTASDTATVNLDRTAPTITAAASPVGNSHGWSNQPVTVTFTCSDSTSGIAECPAPVTVGEGAGQVVSGTATDVAGNTAEASSPTINVDTTPPTIVGTVVTPQTGPGWHSTDVVVEWTCQAGDGSPIDTCPEDTVLEQEGTDQSVSAVAVDQAGNSAQATVTGINVDKTAPTVTALLSGLEGNNGWWLSDVTVDWQATDELSGVSDPANDTISGEGHGLTTTVTVSDLAGNTVTVTSPAVNIDQTTPTTTAAAPSGWSNDTVTVPLSVTDHGGSGVYETRWRIDGGPTHTGTVVMLTEEGEFVLEFASEDVAGNAEGWQSTLVQIDRTAPTISHTLDPDANGNGWHNTGVTVTFDCDDTLSGIASCTPPQHLAQEGAGQTVTGQAVDMAGNSADDIATVSIDMTSPTIDGSVTSAPNSAGWYDTPVTVTFACDDALSGIGTCASPVTLTGDGADQQVAGTATDRAGNSATSTVDGIHIDTTAPTIVGAIDQTPNEHGWFNTDVTVTWTCSDGLSGVDVCPAPTTVTGEGAALVASATATDRAGNTALGEVAGIRIDRTPPTVTFAGNQQIYTLDQQVTIGCTVVDGLSGVATQDCDGLDVPAYTIPGTTTLTGTATDHAGNTGTGSATLNVLVTIDGLRALTIRWADDTLEGGLVAKLDAAAASMRRGNAKSLHGQLGAFRNELAAQSGKGITADHATVLTQLSQLLQ